MIRQRTRKIIGAGHVSRVNRAFRVHVRNEQRAVRVPASDVRQAILAARADALPASAGSAAVLITDDARIAVLNRRFHHSDGPTDVLSFVSKEKNNTVHLDIAVSAETAAANAVRYRSSPAEELLRYCIHGFLHAAGYDDRSRTGREKMRRAERRILAARRHSRPL